MTDWERLKFEDFKRFVLSSQNLNNSKKIVMERLLDEIFRVWNSNNYI